MLRMRMWLIRVLAGKMVVVLNAHLGGPALLNIRRGETALVCNNVFTGSARKQPWTRRLVKFVGKLLRRLRHAIHGKAAA